MNPIYVSDALCGYGKTTAAINHINSSQNKILYVTPLLSEVKRIKTSCPGKSFTEPSANGTKLSDIKRLFKQGRNIVTTHVLFQAFDEEILQSIQEQDYTLFIDETLNVVEQYPCSHFDIAAILSEWANVDSYGRLKWTENEYTGLMNEIRDLSQRNHLYLYKNTALLDVVPPDMFKMFKEVFVLTYMFDGQQIKYYFDLFQIPYEPIYISNGQFTHEKIEYDYSRYPNLIHILDHSKMNEIGDERTSLSKGWFQRSPEGVDKLRKNLINYYRRIINGSTADTLWTTYKDYYDAVVGNGYRTSFLPCNARATNEYSDRTALAYVLNIYSNPVIKNFFKLNGIEFDEDKLALSEMIQWIFRSGIRNGKEVTIYIPSKRMRDLMQNWLDSLK